MMIERSRIEEARKVLTDVPAEFAEQLPFVWAMAEHLDHLEQVSKHGDVFPAHIWKTRDPWVEGPFLLRDTFERWMPGMVESVDRISAKAAGSQGKMGLTSVASMWIFSSSSER